MRYTAFHLDSERGLRGGERQLLYLAAWLKARGHGSVVACRAGVPLEAEARRRGLDVLTLPYGGELCPATAWRLKKAAAAAENPVLHAHTAHAAGNAALTRLLGGPRWVAHRRVDFHLSGPVSARLKYGSAGRLIAVSEFIKGVLAEDGIAPARVDVVPDALPCGAEEERLAGTEPWGQGDRDMVRRRLGMETKALWVGNIASMGGHKDQANLVRAIPAVLKKEPRAEFLFVGDGPLRRELESLVAELKVGMSVRFVGHQEDPRPWLRALDVYCQPSWGEGMGSVLLEAMASRVPIVATTAGGIPEVVEDGRSARLVLPRDSAAASPTARSRLFSASSMGTAGRAQRSSRAIGCA